MRTVTIDYLINHKFERTGLEAEDDNKPNASGMFSAQEVSRLPRTDEDKMEEFKIRISDLIHENGGYKNVYAKTNVNSDNLKKILNIRTHRNMKRDMLAKFVVGMRLSLEEANELFSLHSYPLDASAIRLDAVVIHCIEKGIDIDGFFDTCEQIHLNMTRS